jgi:hypothetical protein
VTCALSPQSTNAGCARPLRTGSVVSGPYVDLDEGRYTAHNVVGAPATCRSKLHADVLLTPTQAVAVAAADAISGGPQVVRVDFSVAQRQAGRGKYEFRLQQTAGEPCAVLRQVRVVRTP